MKVVNVPVENPETATLDVAAFEVDGVWLNVTEDGKQRKVFIPYSQGPAVDTP